MMEINNLENNPILKQLLIDYCLRMYEENAILDDEHLYREYVYLRENNKLDDLFIEEHLIHYLREGWG